ncbi:MAG: heme-binding protein [Clostridia bacterium]|nr:heme-binding protein [Clostridia bacterium]
MNTGGDSMSKYETAPYKVLEKEGPFEIRQYDAFYTAAVEEDTLEGSYGFRQIFDYISGNNEDQTKISMTTPVFNEMKEKKVTTEFVMPSKYSEDAPPKPSSAKVRIRRNEARLSASVTFSGSSTEKKIREYEKELMDWIHKKGLSPSGPFRLARYNPPFIPPLFRRNEILIDVSSKK